MVRSELKSFDDKMLSVIEWNDVAEPLACVQLIHSKGEHAERYGEFCNYLNGRGYFVFAVDLRCHGQTDSFSRGSCFGDVWTESVTDLAFVAKYYKERYPKLPNTIIGFGYGSFLAIRFAEKYKKYIDALVLSANYSLDNLAVNRLICTLMQKVRGENFKSKILNKLVGGSFSGKLDFLSSMEDALVGYKSDENIQFDFSNMFFKSYFNGISKTFKKSNLSNINGELPTLILTGSDDKLGKNGKAADKLKLTFENLGMKCVELKKYQGARHDFLNDVSREEARSDIAGFLDRKVKK